MDTEAKIKKLFENAAQTSIALQESINNNTNSYDFEKTFRKEMKIFEQSVYQTIVGEETLNKNERVKQMTSLGAINMRKGHPFCVGGREYGKTKNRTGGNISKRTRGITNQK